MILKKYKEKRSFKATPEPQAKSSSPPSKTWPVFCVQKHAASHLHYDFRIENDGVMPSWAVPKGPSLDPSQKRLAIHVEDHPLDYRNFEGVIPKGNYGAGTVMIWDEGIYTVPGAKTKKEIEKVVKLGLREGHLELELHGEKLRGIFVLQRLKKDEDKNWLLIKKKDLESNSKLDVTALDHSVRTQRTMDEISMNVEKSSKKKIILSKKGKSKKLPSFVKPMLATLTDKAFDGLDWLYEIKWDGYRALARIDKNVDLMSRNENSFNDTFQPIVKDLSKLKTQALLDGEVVVLDPSGRSNFQLMQNYQRTHQGVLYYYVFDILFLKGQDLRELPLIERKQILKDLLLSVPLSCVRYSDHIEKQGKKLFLEAQKKGLEGIMAKRMDSLYVSRRSREWLKIKTHKRQEVVIGGYTQPRGTRKHFGALLVGIYNDKHEFIYCGHVGGGFNRKLLAEIYAIMKPLEQNICPFKSKPKTNTPFVWIKPQLVCEVSFSEWTTDESMRQPIFIGMRMDKKAKTVKKETVFSLETNSLEPSVSKTNPGDVQVNISHPDKIYWPRLKLTKGNLIDYYQSVSDYILPYLENRPVMLKRFPEGVEKEGFVQKDSVSLHLPAWVNTIEIPHDQKKISYFMIQNKETLQYIANLGTIELHPFLSQINKAEYPNYFVIDLDPEDIEFKYVIETAKNVHALLEELKVVNICKTSGKRGMHICIPMGQKYTFDQALQFGQVIVQYIHQQIPEITSLERQPSRRQKKVYLDILQNHYKQTVIAPYSARGTEDATVSAPLKWTEVKKGLDPKDFNILSMPKRLMKVGDLFSPVIRKEVDIEKALKRMYRMLKNL